MLSLIEIDIVGSFGNVVDDLPKIVELEIEHMLNNERNLHDTSKSTSKDALNECLVGMAFG